LARSIVDMPILLLCLSLPGYKAHYLNQGQLTIKASLWWHLVVFHVLTEAVEWHLFSSLHLKLSFFRLLTVARMILPCRLQQCLRKLSSSNHASIILITRARRLLTLCNPIESVVVGLISSLIQSRCFRLFCFQSLIASQQ